MKKSNLTALAALMACLFMLPSCLNTKDEQFTITQNYSNYINSITDWSDSERYQYPSVGYTIVYNYGNNTANVSITNLRLPDGSTYPTLEFQKVPYYVNSAGWREIRLSNVTPTGTGGFVQAPVFKSLMIQVIDRVAGQYSIPSLTNIKYEIGDYEIYSIPSQLVFGGDNVTTDANGVQYKPQDVKTTYGITLDPAKNQAVITMAAVKFAAAMPVQNMRFKEIPYEITAEGTVMFNRSESFVPYLLSGNTSSTATETPFPGFPISNLSGKYIPSRGFYLDFDCTMMKDNAPVATYKVNIVDKFPIETGMQTQ